MSAVVCVDVGTTMIKAVVFDPTGRELAVVSRRATVLQPRPGWSEQDMLAVLRAVTECVAEAVTRSPIHVGRVALTAQGDGAWLVDERGGPAGPAVLWNDARSRHVVRRWQRSGVLEQAFRTNGSFGNLGLPHAILSWFTTHRCDVLARTHLVLTCGSWLYGALTGTWGLHRSEASAPWLDVGTGEVSAELVELYGLTPWRALVPPVLSGDQLTQPLRPAMADRLGLPAGTPVTLAPYDVVATAAGGGSVAPGDGFCILGTTLCTGAVVTRARTDGVPAGLTLLGDPGAPVVRAFPSLSGTGVLEWMARLLGKADAVSLLDLAEGSVAGAGGVRVWPYLSPAGERAPFLDPDARGLIAGFSLTSTPADLARATVEGLAHVIRDCLQAVGHPTSLLRLSGGGSGSALWCQTIADVIGVPVARAVGSQIGATGAFLYATVAAGDHADLDTAAKMLVAAPQVFTPQEAHRDLFDQRHQEFVATRHALAAQWAGWQDAATT